MKTGDTCCETPQKQHGDFGSKPHESAGQVPKNLKKKRREKSPTSKKRSPI